MKQFDFARIVGPAIKPEHLAGEKEPTALRGTLNFMGVEINSRWGKHAELAIMAELVAGLPPSIRRHVKSLWCNSKLGSNALAIDLNERCDNAGYVAKICHRLLRRHFEYAAVYLDDLMIEG